MRKIHAMHILISAVLILGYASFAKALNTNVSPAMNTVDNENIMLFVKSEFNHQDSITALGIEVIPIKLNK